MIILANLLKIGWAIKGVMVDEVESIGYRVIPYIVPFNTTPPSFTTTTATKKT